MNGNVSRGVVVACVDVHTPVQGGQTGVGVVVLDEWDLQLGSYSLGQGGEGVGRLGAEKAWDVDVEEKVLGGGAQVAFLKMGTDSGLVVMELGRGELGCRHSN